MARFFARTRSYGSVEMQLRWRELETTPGRNYGGAITNDRARPGGIQTGANHRSRDAISTQMTR